MGVFSNTNNLPGVITEIEADYSFGYDTSLFGTTDSEVIIGTAFDGPVGTVVPVYSPEHAAYIFGKSYDSKTKQEANLVAGIQDAWERGCRTIYAVRIGGVELYKDFDFAVDLNMKLRVSAANPSNLGKQVYMFYDGTPGAETIKFYKPAGRATIAEKMQGLVTSDHAVLVTELRLNQDFGYGRDSKLVELIRLVNEHDYNNVLKLSVVDANGVDITNSTEVYEVAIGAMYPGVYFIGRDASKCTSFTDVKFNLIEDATSPKPYADFAGFYYRKLAINTDVSAPLPIYAESMSDLRDILRDVNIAMVKEFDFLEVAGLADRAFSLDTKDYEEVKMSPFEAYKRLGSGFATTAIAERRVDGSGNELTPRIKETPMDDSNRIIAIKDGIYSMLENAAIKYRVLNCGAADEVITGKLPRPSDFLIAMPEEINVLDGLIRVIPKISAKDQTSSKEYKFKFENLTSVVSDNLSDIYTETVLPVISSISAVTELDSKNVKSGTQVMLIDATGQGTLIRVGTTAYETLSGEGLVGELFIVDGSIYEGQVVAGAVVFNKVVVTPISGGLATFRSKEYVLGQGCDHIFVFQVVDDALVHVKALGDLKTMLSENVDKSLVYVQSNYFEANPVVVRSALFDALTLEEFIEFMNQHEVLGQVFSFELTDKGAEVKDNYVSEVASAALDTAEYHMSEDRKLGYDYSLYIPYKTTDNFARQLAQHCTYTELKTTPTFGKIGCKRIMDTSLVSVAKKVEELLEREFDLYAKNDAGRNMLDRNNYPYPIGKNISIIFAQYFVNMDDGYRFMSNAAAGYGGMVSTLPLDQSSTNQPIAVPTPLFNLTNYQLTRLTAKGIVTLKQSFTRGTVITDGITMAPVASVFRRLAASRIIGAVEDLIRQAAEPFIGKQNHSANRNSLQTAIKSNLDKIKGRLIEAYDFNMVIDPKVMKFSYIDINYKIVPIYEIREIRNRISVKDQL
jgi:hypothetical protein